jgi:hypothetical protein
MSFAVSRSTAHLSQFRLDDEAVVVLGHRPRASSRRIPEGSNQRKTTDALNSRGAAIRVGLQLF